MHAVDDETGTFAANPALTFKHEYPPTKLMFLPDPEGTRPDLMATTGGWVSVLGRVVCLPE